MRLSKEKMQESGAIDYVTLLGAVEEIKRVIHPQKEANDYSVLLFGSVYFVVDYDANYTDHECPSRYSLLQNSDFIFRIASNQVEILKSRMMIEEARGIFESRGITVYRTCARSHVDEE